MDKELNIKGLNMHLLFRIISVLLMLFSISTTTYAELKGKGTKAEPYLIDEPSDFEDLRTTISSNKDKYLYVRQISDIDMADISEDTRIKKTRPPFPLAGIAFSGGIFRVPSGTPNYFVGEYDGGGFTVSNWILKSNQQMTGLNTKAFNISMFGKVGKSSGQKSVIKNLNIDGYDIQMTTTKSGASCAGYSFLVSDVQNADITNVHIKNSKCTGNGHFTFGAIAANNDDAEISNCSVRDSEFNPQNGSVGVGSFCGVNAGNIKNCFADNMILNGDEYVGGLVGEMTDGVVENCGFNGQIGVDKFGFTIDNSGGLCGKVNHGTFINCFTAFDNGGDTWSRASVFGGLVGIVADDATITLKNCYAYPQIRVENDKRDNVDFFVGRDMNKEDDSRTYESLYCYVDGFGKNFIPYLKDGVEFTPSFMEDHKIMKAESDFMRSGCFAEVLSDFHVANLAGENQWREDVEFQNDTLPVLRFMVGDAYDVKPFCHPGIYTLSHSESGSVSKINGRLKYITDDQLTEGWVFGLEVKVGNNDWQKVSSVTPTSNGNKIDFFNDYSYSKSKTTVYRAYTLNPANPSLVAYGKVDTICVGASGPEIIEGCDSLEYDGKKFYRADNGDYKNSLGEVVTINIGETRTFNMPLLKGECGAESLEFSGKIYDKSGKYEVTSIKNETGCMTYTYQEVKLYPTKVVDSLKVLTLGEDSYTYVPKGVGSSKTISVGSDYVKEPVLLMEDFVKYPDNSLCDSIRINVKYVVPIKETKTIDATWSCNPVVYNGVTFTKDTIVKDTIKTADPSVVGGMLYEIRSRYIKVMVADTNKTTKTWCEFIEVPCADGICPVYEPFYDTTYVKSGNPECQCPTSINIVHHVIGEKPTRDTSIVSCGPYVYTYKGKSTTWSKSGDYTVKRSGKNVGACTNDTMVTYHLTIGESTVYNDTIIHGCGKKVYKTLSGETKIFDKTQDFVDEITTKDNCSSKRTVHVYIHKTIDKSPFDKVTECAPFEFERLNGEKVTLEAGTYTISDTIKSKDDCGCDSIVKTTKLVIDDPVTLAEKTVTGCNEVVIEGVKYTENTSFVVKKLDPNLMKTCRVQFQPYNVVINTSSIEYHNIDTCGVYYLNGEAVTSSTKKEINIPNSTGCDNKEVYNIRIIEPIKIDSVVYACDNYVHKYYDGHQELVTEDGIVLTDIIQSKVCLCDSVIRTIKVNISHDSQEILPVENHCGPFAYHKKSNGQVIMIESSQIVYDTLVNKYGCSIFYETEVNISPVITLYDTLDACNEYHSIKPVWNYNNVPVNFEINSPKLDSTELIFLETNELNSSCKDTTKLFLRLHGSGKITAEPVVACDSYIYTDFDGTERVITSDEVIVDTLKSKTCDCDSVILTTDVKINYSIPEHLRETKTIRECDSVVYVNAKGVEMIFKDDISFLDTFQITSTGCDSVVNVEVTVPKSTGSVTILSVCGDTTLYDEVNDNFPHYFEESGVWRQILSENEVGCSNYKEWHVKVTPTPRDTVFETGCGELSFHGDTYTSENDKASSFSLVLEGNTKCDSIHHYYLTVYPKYNVTEEFESCDSVVRNGVVYKESILFRDTLMSRNNCDSIVNVNIVVNPAVDVTAYDFGCNKIKFLDEDYNGGVPVDFDHDTTIFIQKYTNKGCEYTLTQHLQVGYPQDSVVEIYECVDTKSGYFLYHDLQLTKDTILYDTIDSGNKCGTVITNIVNIERCFPYPVLVNKYNWILVCNDVIMDDDKFKLKSNVKYNWYKDDRLMLSTTDNFFTEDKELDGCYQVGIVVENGDEYLSDIVCIDENHGYSISPQPNPVEKLQPVTIVCDFPVEGVIGTEIEVFNMQAEKVYISRATSNQIVIPGMTVSGYYLVRLTTVTGKVLTAKYVVK